MTNYKKLVSFVAILALAFALAPAPALAQGTALNTTTISSAITSGSATQVTLASATGVSVAGPNNQINTMLYMDRELMGVVSLASGTTYNVRRGLGNTRPVAHASGAAVYLGPATGNFYSNNPSNSQTWGSCLYTQEPTLPKIYVVTGDIFDCKRTGAAGTSGQWIKVSEGTMAPAGRQIGNFCTGTAGSAETEYLNGAACSGATTATARVVIGAPGTLANLYVFSSAAFTGGTNKDVITVYKNGSATAITCTAAAAATTCSDTTHSVAVVAGDVLTFQFVSATSDTAANVSAVVGLY